jgi:DNA primase
LDEENSILTVYLNNLSGQFVGYQQYRPLETAKRLNDPRESRYFTYSPKDTTAVWGLETLDRSKDKLYIVEGIFKASTLHMLGHNAIAVLTSHPKAMKSWLHTLPFELIGIGDNDKAGKGIISVAGKGFQLERDVDEYDLEELQEILNA